MNPIILVGAGILLLGLGIGLGFWSAQSQRNREATRASDIQNELDAYRRHVTEHFGETAQHFQTLGQQYQSLYQHMAKGADALCDAAQSDALLDFAAANAPAIAARTADEEEKHPDVIRDYATEDEIEPLHVEAEIETTTPSEPPENSAVADDKTAEPPAEEVIQDQVAAADPVETDRTVH